MANPTPNDTSVAAQDPSQAPAVKPPAGGHHSTDSRWQRRLLPFLVGTLGVLTVLFCAAIAWETRLIQTRMESALEIDLRPAVSQEFRSNPAFLLEADLIERRYRAADAAALSRLYIMFLGFGTGMVLALVGATFVLGKISEQETSFDGGAPSFKASLHSGSPGIILAFLGTALMLSTIFSKTEISLSDRAVYMGGVPLAGAAPQPEANSNATETPKISQPSKPDPKTQSAATQKSTPATPDTLLAKSDERQPDTVLVMSSQDTVEGEYSLDLISGPGTLSIHGKEVKFSGRDGNKRRVQVHQIDSSHVAFTVTEPDGARQEFDGYLGDENLVGSTTYHGSSTSGPFGFTATRIKPKATQK